MMELNFSQDYDYAVKMNTACNSVDSINAHEIHKEKTTLGCRPLVCFFLQVLALSMLFAVTPLNLQRFENCLSVSFVCLRQRA